MPRFRANPYSKGNFLTAAHNTSTPRQKRAWDIKKDAGSIWLAPDTNIPATNGNTSLMAG
ncbi:MAG: hypothetical protein MJY79_02080 [Bacteroidaceae bacterium]|nr:hypothetical protein [Bacteroidaceae bacterium]